MPDVAHELRVRWVVLSSPALQLEGDNIKHMHFIMCVLKMIRLLHAATRDGTHTHKQLHVAFAHMRVCVYIYIYSICMDLYMLYVCMHLSAQSPEQLACMPACRQHMLMHQECEHSFRRSPMHEHACGHAPRHLCNSYA